MPVLDRDAFAALIAQLADMPPGTVYWEVDPNNMVSDTVQAEIQLTLFSLSALHVDEHRRHISDGTDGYPAGAFITQEIGNRELRIQLVAKTFNKGVEAAELLDKVRTAIRADTAVAQLNGMNLALEWIEKTQRLPTVYEQRAVSVASCEFKFGGINQIVAVIPPNQGGDYIATVNAPLNNAIGTFTE